MAMRIIDKMRKQTAVYWGSPVPDGQGGWSFATPVELTPDDGTGVRWEDKQELFVDPQGDEIMSAAIVYPGQDLDIGGYLYLGTEASLSSDHSDPTEISDAIPIAQFGKIPTLDNTQVLRTAWLRKQ